MTQISDLRGYSYPLTPKGTSSVVGDLPWHYGTENLNFLYKTDPDAVAAYLPEPLEPGDRPDTVYVSFSKWYSLWDNQLDMAVANPERARYSETIVWVSSSFKGLQGQTCIAAWVDNDFTLARGWFMGFPKKLGRTYQSEYHHLNPAMSPVDVGTRIKAFTVAHGERLMEGTLAIERQVPGDQLPAPMGLPVLNIRHFPSIVPGAPPSVHELVRIDAEHVRRGDVWAGSGELVFGSSNTEELMADLPPLEVLGAYCFSSGYTITGGEVLHSWV
jgi:acetoacetate decarboxylase